MDAEMNNFKIGATMVTEYDLPKNSELSEGGDVPWCVLVCEMKTFTEKKKKKKKKKKILNIGGKWSMWFNADFLLGGRFSM